MPGNEQKKDNWDGNGNEITDSLNLENWPGAISFFNEIFY